MEQFKNILVRFKFYIAFIVLALGVYIYAGLAGKKFFGSDSEKWQPEGEKHYHK